jgi:hypothetical protein
LPPPRVAAEDDPPERVGPLDAIAGDLAERAGPQSALADDPPEQAESQDAIVGDPLAQEFAAEPVRFSVAQKAAGCAQVARAGWVPDDSHQDVRRSIGSVRASAHWRAVDLDPGDYRAELMVDDHCAPADLPVRGEHSAGSAQDGSAAPTTDDHCAPADHPVLGERSADSAQDDSAVPMVDDHCGPADHPVRGERSAPADLVAAGYSADWLRADCWRQADLQVADCPRAGRFPVVRLELAQGLAARVWQEEQPSLATPEDSVDAVSPVPGEARAFRGVVPAVAVSPQTPEEAAVALSWRSQDDSRLPEAAPRRDLRCWHARPARLRAQERLLLWPLPASP